MSNSTITKKALALSLKECMQNEPLDKISIGEICSRCGLNRKSFYYHFRDKYELVNWIYETEMNSKVMNYLSEKKASELALMICQYIYDNRTFYNNALQVSGPHSFHDYFCRKIEPLVKKTLDKDSTLKMDLSEVSDLIGDFCLSAVRRWIGVPEPKKPEMFLEDLINISVTLCGRLLALFI